MNNIKEYNRFLIISFISRNILEIFSIVFLYNKVNDINKVFYIFFLIYLVGIFINIITLAILNEKNYKLLLLISNLIYIITFIYLNIFEFNIYIYSSLFSISSFSFHSIRHYLALQMKMNMTKKWTICMYIGTIISSIIVGFVSNKILLVLITLVVSGISFFPLYKMKKVTFIKNNCFDYKDVDRKKILFFVLEQARILFLLFQPLYLYINISNNMNYIGIFYIINAIFSLIALYFLFNKVYLNKYYRLIIYLVGVLFFLKLIIFNKYIILIIGIFEGILVKIYENYSLINLYNIKKGIDRKKYLIFSEVIFCLVRCLFCLLFMFIKDIKVVLYILLLIVFLNGSVKFNNIEKKD